MTKINVRLALILTTLSFVFLLIFVTSPPPASQAAFPGNNGEFSVIIDLSGAWDLDTWEIYKMDAGGKNQKRLTDNSEYENYPAWSPGGKKIAFIRRLQDGNHDIYMMDADGKNQTNLTNTPTVDEAYVAWSPDGTKLVVCIDPDGNFDLFDPVYNNVDIFVMDADGGNPTNLTNNDVEEWGAVWSPDGQRIAFTTNRDGNTEIYVMGVDGSNPTNLTNNPASDGFFAPSWSPDGNRIAFVSDRDGNNEVYVMDADGSNPTRMTNNPAVDALPVWSANGEKIAFRTNRDGNSEVYVMDADGSNPTNLTNSPMLEERLFDWQSLGFKALLPIIFLTDVE